MNEKELMNLLPDHLKAGFQSRVNKLDVDIVNKPYSEAIKQHMKIAKEEGIASQVENVIKNLFYMFPQDMNAVTLHITPHLHQQLKFMDMGNKTTYEFLKFPYPFIYIHAPYGFCDECHQEGNNIVGMYVYQEDMVMHFMFISESMKVVGYQVEFDHEQEIISEVLEDAMSNKDILRENVDAFKALTVYAFNVCLYLNLDRHESKQINEAPELKVAIARTSKVKKKRLLTKKLNNSYPYILVGSQKPPQSLMTTRGNTANKATHWRRGHTAIRWYGKMSEERKKRLVWIAPQLINADKLVGDAPEIKNYKLTINQ